MSPLLAERLSILLGPHLWLPFLLITFLFRTGLTEQQIKTLLPPLLILQVITPLAYLYMAPRLGWASSWDLPRRIERLRFFILVFFVSSISLLLVFFFGSKLLLYVSLLLFVLMMLTGFLTYFSKISLHVSLNTFGSVLVNVLFEWHLPFLYLSVPLVFWARLILKKHTINQLLAPIAINGVVIVAALYYLGYVRF